MAASKRKYYVTKGRTGVVITQDYAKARYCEKYLWKPTIESFSTFEDAESDALTHLALILPPDVIWPERVPFSKVLTICNLRRAQALEEKEFLESQAHRSDPSNQRSHSTTADSQ